GNGFRPIWAADKLNVNANSSVTVTGPGAYIDLSADAIAIDPTASLNAFGLMVGPNLFPPRGVAFSVNTATTVVDVGGADAPGVLGLTDAELDRVFVPAGTTAGILIGSSHTGGSFGKTAASITVSAEITRANSSVIALW